MFSVTVSRSGDDPLRAIWMQVMKKDLNWMITTYRVNFILLTGKLHWQERNLLLLWKHSPIKWWIWVGRLTNHNARAKGRQSSLTSRFNTYKRQMTYLWRLAFKWNLLTTFYFITLSIKLYHLNGPRVTTATSLYDVTKFGRERDLK